MRVEIVGVTHYVAGDGSSEALLERAGRACYRSEKSGDTARFLQARLREGHESLIEHASITFDISGISRACSHQLVRHRIASYSQESQRYCQYGALGANLAPKPQPLPEARGEKRNGHCHFTVEQEQFIAKQYADGFGCDVLGTAYDVHPTTIREIVLEHGVAIRSMREAKTTHVSTEFFAEIDAPEKAHALGLIYADGNVAFRGANLSHASIAQHVDYSAWLKRLGGLWGGSVVSGGRERSVRLTIPGLDTAEHLVRHGVAQKKSRILTGPALPFVLSPHFIRGYLEGDGYIGAKEPSIVITSGSHDLLEWILQQSRVVTDKGSISGKDVFRLSWAGSICVPVVLGWLYQDFDFRLSHPAKLERVIQWSVDARDSYFYQLERWAQKFDVVVPPDIKQSPVAMSLFIDTIEALAQAYANVRALGVRKEDARFLLPNATATRIIVTMNFRSLRHFFTVRCDRAAQWEIRELAVEMLRQAHGVAPAIFQDLYDQFVPPAGE